MTSKNVKREVKSRSEREQNINCLIAYLYSHYSHLKDKNTIVITVDGCQSSIKRGITSILT